MRISTTMTVGFAGVSLAVLGAHAAWQVVTERSDLEHAVEKEMRLVGRSIQVAVENALRTRQPQEITDTLEKLDRMDPAVDIFVYDVHGVPSAASPERDFLPPPRLVPEPAFRFRDMPMGPAALLTLPLKSDDGVPQGHLLVVRPTHDMEADLDRTRRLVAITTLVLVALTAALQYALGRLYIQRPMQRLAAAMRQVREGARVEALPNMGSDEVESLAQDFNLMLGELSHAREQLAQETEARRLSQQHLLDVSRLVAVGQLSAGLAHEIGSPLQVLGGRARAMLSPNYDVEQLPRHARILVDQTDRITRIVEQLLRYSRRSGGRRAPTDVAVAVRAVADLLDLEARHQHVTLTVRCAQDLPRVDADADQLQQLTLNLVSNALRAVGRDGNVRVEVERVTTPRGPGVRLTVADNGPGMTAEVQARLFEPFFTTHEDQGGTGLGLAIVKSIVQDHGATLQVDSSPGSGAAFRVDFPALEAS
jgi:signal transduction histidine kinase